MFLFYSKTIQHRHILLSEDEHLHCTKVLRHKIGDKIHVTDGIGNLYQGAITHIGKSETTLIIEDTIKSELPPRINAIAISPTKTPARLEWFVEKAVEIGIQDIHIFIAQRTEKKSTNTTRIEKIALTAMKQSLRTYLPAVHTHGSIAELINSTSSISHKFIAHLDGPTATLHNSFARVGNNLVLIGPEGDFTPKEINTCLSSGFTAVTLGDMRLRTETAGLVALMTMTL
jgi:16S rRNA (uracil1498-N3)-methyltransferase